jgi:hypothetical protein
MARKIAASTVKAWVEELINIQVFHERYQELEKLIKDGLVELKFTEMEIPGKGRVLISQSEQVTVPVEVATDVLGWDLASKVIVTRKSVSNEIIKAFVQAGEISEAQREQLLARSEKKPKVSLYVRPLK